MIFFWDQIAYSIGILTVDLIVYTVGGSGIVSLYKYVRKFQLNRTRIGWIFKSVNKFAKAHSISSVSVDDVTTNLFNCLEYID